WQRRPGLAAGASLIRSDSTVRLRNFKTLNRRVVQRARPRLKFFVYFEFRFWQNRSNSRRAVRPARFGQKKTIVPNAIGLLASGRRAVHVSNSQCYLIGGR